ncbi:hypothetical protein AB3N02_21695 [Priestia aryabhattai]|uniref:hypothetical protein n=1 Tax=Priestia aryabhattai TaxID=412384 RepID=UPI00399F984D
MTIFIPKKINVGFQERQGTYTGKLSYIIYFDERGKLRKETSWNSWRDSKIDNVITENVPTSGFVLNKKVGGYDTGWNHRNTYVRVYDPRGFEFEIDVVNLLYILENTSSIKGKGLEGEFVYGWEGKNLILIPVDSPDYKNISKLNELIHAENHLKAKDLKIGATYLTKDNKHYVYMGKFDEYEWRGGKQKTKSFYFYQPDTKYHSFITMKSVSRKLVDTVSEECIEDFADVMDKLESQSMFSPVDDSKDEFIPFTKEELEEKFKDRYWAYFYVGGTLKEGAEKRRDDELELRIDRESGTFYYQYKNPNYVNPYTYWGYGRGRDPDFKEEPYNLKVTYNSVEEVMEDLKPLRKRKYLQNGKVYSEGY